MFVGLHAVFAERTGMAELGLSFEEGEQFMASAQNVLRHYSVSTTQKTLDWVAFFGVAAGIYGTRFAAVMMRRQQESADAAPGGYGMTPAAPRAPTRRKGGAGVVQPFPIMPGMGGPDDGQFHGGDGLG